MLSLWEIILWYQYAISVTAVPSTQAVYSKSNATCPSRTANYLTHTLPQQCLTSPRLATSTQASPQASDTPSTDIASTATGNITPPEVQSSLTSDTHTAFSEASHNEIITSSASQAIESPNSVTTVTAVQIASQDLVPAPPYVIEEDSPLESGNFLSFEEWKKQNLEKAGQSEHIGRDAKVDSRDGRQRQQHLEHSLDSLGDDVEIDLDFSGFVPDGPGKPNARNTKVAESTDADGNAVRPNMASGRKKDAGTTCKERFNYASFDCAASMLKTNPQAKSPGSVLSENKDAYMLNDCSAENKFMIVELCNDILVDTVVLANFEFFSSIFREFRVSVSDRYPVKVDKWKVLGVFEARNTRDVQAFLVENPMIWARYVRIEFLTHYGSEFYCPVSLLRVHGTTMLEEYKHDTQAVTEDDDEESEPTEGAAGRGEILEPEAIDQQMLAEEKQKQKQEQEDRVSTPEGLSVTDHSTARTSSADQTQHETCTVPGVPTNVTMAESDIIFAVPSLEICPENEAPQTTMTRNTTTAAITTQESKVATVAEATSNPASASTTGQSVNSTEPSSPEQTQVEMSQSTVPSYVPPSSNSTQVERSSSSILKPSQNATFTERAKVSSSSSEKSRQSSSATQPAPASPTMQESFFKSVQKRLQMLESNSSLSLQYIEEQSRALRDAFQIVEKRQLLKTSLFLDHLNATVLKELREFRQQYDNLWQSTVIELDMQRELYQRENQAMHARLGVLADELIFQKRISILQMTLILVCLVLVLFSRGVINNYLELPLVQSVLSKSSSTRWMNLSSDSSNITHKLSRTRSAMSIGSSPNGILKGHRRLQSEDSITDTLSQSELYSPPTPVSFDGFSDASQSLLDEGKPVSDPEFDAESIERPSTSPPILASTSEPTTPRSHDTHFGSFESRIFATDPTIDGLNLPLDVKSVPASPAKHLKWNLPETDEDHS